MSVGNCVGIIVGLALCFLLGPQFLPHATGAEIISIVVGGAFLGGAIGGGYRS